MTAQLARILHVEDDPDIQAIATLALERLGGYTVKTCSSGAEALETVAGFGPDLILLDVMMPGMDGPTTLGRLRSLPAAAGVPVVFMTAKVQPSEMEEYRQMGAAGVIVKPFDPMTLAQQLREIWETARGGA